MKLSGDAVRMAEWHVLADMLNNVWISDFMETNNYSQQNIFYNVLLMEHN